MRNYKTFIYIFTVILLFLSVFMLMRYNDMNVKAPFYVSVSSGGETEQIDCWENENNEYYVFLPGYAELAKVQIGLNTENTVSINGTHLTDGMFCSDLELDVPYTLTYSSFGKKHNHSLTFLRSDKVSSMYIETASGNMDYIHEKKDNEESGTVSLYTPEGELDYSGKLESIKGRGNYTWEAFDKKPYSLKLTNDANLLGMGQAQKWILLANADDTSNLRNKVVYDFADKAGLEYSPDSQWVDLYLNGEYAGLYLLCERNEVHPERVDIAENDSFLVSLELEERLISQNYTYISTESGQAMRVHYPLNSSGESLSSLAATWQSVENALIAENGIDPLTGKSWQEMIDLDSWAKKYLIEEIFGNYDSCSISQYFYRDGNNGKIYAGPVWDFDHSIGNEVAWQLLNPKALYANRLHVSESYDTPWFYSLYQKEEFYNRTVEIYQNEFLPLFEDLLNTEISNYTAHISKAAALNQIRWFDDTERIDTQAEYIRDYMTDRLAFLNSIWLDDASYHLVRADSSFGVNYAYYAVFPGECLPGLPTFENAETSDFLGWYYADTDEPFDITKPIYEDTAIYAKWQDTAKNKIDNIFKLIPLAVIAVIFIVLFIIEIKRMKGNR